MCRCSIASRVARIDISSCSSTACSSGRERCWRASSCMAEHTPSPSSVLLVVQSCAAPAWCPPLVERWCGPLLTGVPPVPPSLPPLIPKLPSPPLAAPGLGIWCACDISSSPVAWGRMQVPPLPEIGSRLLGLLQPLLTSAAARPCWCGTASLSELSLESTAAAAAAAEAPFPHCVWHLLNAETCSFSRACLREQAR